MTTRVLIADDHGFTLAGMEAALSAHGGFDVVGTAQGGLDTIAQGRRLRPDLAVLDFAMPDATGLEVFLELRRWTPDTRCAVVTGVTEAETLRQIVEAGVHGLFQKGDDPDEIVAGLVRVAGGARVVPDGLEAGDETKLSGREIEVLMGISRGQSNREIADSLSISPKTVETHRASLMRKFEVHSTAALVVAAVRSGHLKV